TTQQEEQLKTVQSSAKHLLSLINDLLDLTKIESGKVDLRLETVALQSVIHEVVTTLRPLAEGKGLRLETATCQPEGVVQTDGRILAQILMNLGGNAIKFTESGWVRIEVDRYAEGGRERIEIRVVDTGIGIRPADQAELFQAFKQVKDAARGRAEGTGLG